MRFLHISMTHFLLWLFSNSFCENVSKLLQTDPNQPKARRDKAMQCNKRERNQFGISVSEMKSNIYSWIFAVCGLQAKMLLHCSDFCWFLSDGLNNERNPSESHFIRPPFFFHDVKSAPLYFTATCAFIHKNETSI